MSASKELHTNTLGIPVFCPRPIEQFEDFYPEIVRFSPDSYALLRRRRLETGQLRWANLIFFDLCRGIQFFYDHNSLKDGLSEIYFGKNPHKPFQAVISFAAAREQSNGRIATPVGYGRFWYDRSGNLKEVSAGGLTHSRFDLGEPEIFLRSREDGAWDVIRITDILEPGQKLLQGETVQPTSQPLLPGQETVYDEIVYKLTVTDGTVEFKVQSIPGHKCKVINVPYWIDIHRWAELLNGSNGSWVQVFREFPSSIELTV